MSIKNNSKIRGLGRGHVEQVGRKTKRMWKLYMRHGWRNFNWPGMMMWKAEDQAAE